MLPSRVHNWNGNIPICPCCMFQTTKWRVSPGRHHKMHEALRINLTVVEL